MKTEFATLEHLPMIGQLLETRDQLPVTLRNQHYYKPIDYYQRMIHNPELAWGKIRIVVCVDDSGLAGMLQMLFRPGYPSWVLFGTTTRPGHSYYNCATNGISQMLEFALDQAEQQGYYQYDYIYREGRNGANRYQRMIDQIPALQRYDHYFLGRIARGERSRFQAFDLLLAQQPARDNFIAKTGLLRAEYRQNPEL